MKGISPVSYTADKIKKRLKPSIGQHRDAGYTAWYHSISYNLYALAEYVTIDISARCNGREAGSAYTESLLSFSTLLKGEFSHPLQPAFTSRRLSACFRLLTIPLQRIFAKSKCNIIGEKCQLHFTKSPK